MCDFRLIEIDDGHKPGRTTKPTQLAINSKPTRNFCSVFDELLPENWRERAYEYAKQRIRPWGVYILPADAVDESIDLEGLWLTDPQRALGIVATRNLIYGRASGLLADMLPLVHGTVVWCLTSGVNSNVVYHIDYAELYRYETNIIHPPLIGGVYHVSPFYHREMQGGDFLLNVGGLEHYKKFGYKGRLSSTQGGIDLMDDVKAGVDWMTIPYRANRAVLFDGDFPHLSSAVGGLPAGERRVIFGFNCFTSEVGACCLRAPEHSDAFNRTIKMYQQMAQFGVSMASGDVSTVPEQIGDSADSKYGDLGISSAKTADDGGLTASTNSFGSGSLSAKVNPMKLTIEDVKRSPFLKKLVLAAAKAKKATPPANDVNPL